MEFSWAGFRILSFISPGRRVSATGEKRHRWAAGVSRFLFLISIRPRRAAASDKSTRDGLGCFFPVPTKACCGGIQLLALLPSYMADDQSTHTITATQSWPITCVLVSVFEKVSAAFPDHKEVVDRCKLHSMIIRSLPANVWGAYRAVLGLLADNAIQMNTCYGQI